MTATKMTENEILAHMRKHKDDWDEIADLDGDGWTARMGNLVLSHSITPWLTPKFREHAEAFADENAAAKNLRDDISFMSREGGSGRIVNLKDGGS